MVVIVYFLYTSFCIYICYQSSSYTVQYTFLLQAVDTNYTNAAAKAGPSQVVMFEEDEIKLDIAAEGVALGNGWTITPYTHPGVSLTQKTKSSN